MNKRLEVFDKDVLGIITQFNYISTMRVPSKSYQCSKLVSALNILETMSRKKGSDYKEKIRFYLKKEKEIYTNILISKIRHKTNREKRFQVYLFRLKRNNNPKLPINLGGRCRSYQDGLFTIGECGCVTQEEFNNLKRTKDYSGAKKGVEQICK